MSIGPIGATAASGAQLGARVMQASAHNVANVTTDGFQAQRVVASEAAGGGVTSTVTPTGAPSPTILRDGALVTASNTSLVDEAVNRTAALATYQANLGVLRSSDEMTATLLDAVA